jgi:class 3 adenylate cyclase
MMRLSDEMPGEQFDALLEEYELLLRRLFEQLGARDVDVSGDTATAAFVTARDAVLAAVAAERAVATHEWPHGAPLSVSVGLDSAEAESAAAGAALVCSELCDAAEGGQIFLSQATASLLADEDLGELSLRDLGEQRTRRTDRSVRAYELVLPAPAAAS